MPTRLTGTPSFASLGVQAPQPPNIVAINRAPTVNDFANFNTGDLWLNTISLIASPPTAPTATDIWMLVSKDKRINNATWVQLGGAGDLRTLTGNNNGIFPPGPVSGDVNHNINTLGDNIGITVVGNPGTNTLTWSLVGGGGGVATQSFHTDDNNVEVPIGTVVIPAVGSVGQINVLGGNTVPNTFINIKTRQGADIHTVAVDLNNSIIQPFTSAAGTEGVYSLGTTSIVVDRFLHGFGQTNVFVGRQSGNFTMNTANANTNTCVGNLTGNSLVGAAALEGTLNTFLGSQSGKACTSGSANLFAGASSGVLATTSGANVALGSGSASALLTGNNNVFAGFDSGLNYTTNESGNVVIGYANDGRAGENNTIRIGGNGAAVATTDNIFIGRDSATAAYNVAVATNNVFIGANNATALTTGSANVALSGGALSAITSGTRNVAISAGSGNGITTGSNNVLAGYTAGGSYTLADSSNIVIGSGNLGKVGEVNIIRIGSIGLPTGDENIFIGRDSGNFTYTPGIGNCEFNISVGGLTLTALTTARGATAMGHGSLLSLTSGDDCAAYGYNSATAITTGSRNDAFGNGSLLNLLTGSDNTCIGDDSGQAFNGAESSNIIIGSGGGAGSIGNIGDNNTLRIGLSTGAGAAQLNRAFIAGIRGIVTGVNDAVAVLVDSANQLGTVSSSKEFKDNINDMESYSNVLYKLRPVTFNYKQYAPEIISVGLIAEEVEEVMPRLVAYQGDKPLSVKYHDLPAMLLNELQKLEKRVSELERKCSCQN